MIGSELLHYRVTRALGSGGMGEVYLAEDMRLKRSVAIKILPPAVAAHADRRDRFEREAQAVAALNHPNIVTIHSVEKAPSTGPGQSDTHFITMEYVDGRTLADLLPKDGFPLRRLLTIAIQIADAVAVAHQHGIVHRDLKPANVMITGQDRVKVLDFGLAKLRDATADAAGGALPTRELTGEGTIVGTVAYMSPEQAEGRTVDERSDIFSLGVVLYEMATGDRPFKGDTNLSILSSVLRDTPKTLTELNPSLPRDFVRIVRHCLIKDPEHRYQSAKDLRNDLQEVQQALDSGEFAAPLKQQPRSNWWPAAAAGLGAIGLVALVAAIWLKTSAGSSTAPPAARHTRLTQMAGLKRFPSLSPDGKWVVYSADGDIYLQSVTGQTPINLTKDTPSAETMPAFSPDGESIAFRSDRDGGGIFVMGRTGEAVRRVTTQGFQPAWLPDGRQIVFSTQGPQYPVNWPAVSQLWIVDTQGGPPRQIFAGDAVQPRVSPHGKRIAFWAVPTDGAAKRPVTGSAGVNYDIWTIDLDGTHPVRATMHDAADWSPTWAPDGRWLYFLSDRAGSMNLWRVAIDESSGVTTGDPQPLTAPAQFVADFSLAADGAIATYSSILFSGNIGRIDFDAHSATVKGQVSSVTSGPHEIANIDVVGEGRSIVASTLLTHEDLYIAPSDGGAIRRVTSDRAKDRAPRWTPDGRHILFNSDRSGVFEIWRVGADGGGLQRLTTSGHVYPVPSRDGTKVAAAEPYRPQIVIFDSRDFAKPLEILPPFSDSIVDAVPSDWSPDGRQLAIDALASNRVWGVWVYSFDTRKYRRVGDGWDSSWLAEGRRLLCSNAGRLSVIDTIAGDTKELLAIPGETLRYPLAIAEASKLVFTRTVFSSDIWTMRFGDK